MSTVFSVLVALHLLFMAALVGGYFVAAAQKGAINPVMVWGARMQLVTGLLLMTLASAAGHNANHMVLGIKLVIALGAVACAEIAASKAKNGAAVPTLVHASGALALANFLIGVLAL